MPDQQAIDSCQTNGPCVQAARQPGSHAYRVTHPSLSFTGFVIVIGASCVLTSCDHGRGDLTTTTLTTGEALDADGYTIMVDGAESEAVGVNASVSFAGLRAGNRTVRLIGVAPNCSVGGDNPRTVTVAAGRTGTTVFDVSCSATPSPGPIVVDPSNPVWLSYENGDPFFMVGAGDPEGFLYRGSRNNDGTRAGDQLILIDKLARTGANSIYMQAVRSHGGDGGDDENPFIDSDPSKGLDPDILHQWQTWFSEMDRNRIVIFFMFYDDSADPWGGRTMGAIEQQFIADIVNRFKHHDHLIWCVAEEYSERLTTTRVSQIAGVIRANDSKHAVAVHQLAGTSFDFADDPNLDQFAMQLKSASIDDYHSAILEAGSKGGRRHNLNAAELFLNGTPQGNLPTADLRRTLWAATMGGAYSMVLGWTIGNTATEDIELAGSIVRFMERARVNRMTPDDTRAAGTTDWVLVEAPSNSFIAYTTDATGPMGVTAMEAGMYHLTWLDTARGDLVEQEGVTVNAGINTFRVPDGIKGNEVAVHIQRVRS